MSDMENYKLKCMMALLLLIVMALAFTWKPDASMPDSIEPFADRPLPLSPIHLRSSASNQTLPFKIDDNSKTGLNWTTMRQNWWINGSGTSADPYVIRNITITANSTGKYCIKIANSSAHVTIRDSFFNATKGVGIDLYNVTNVKILNCTFSDHSTAGIQLYDCLNCRVENNTITESRAGIVFELTGYSRIEDCNIIDNSGEGIKLIDSNECTISSNYLKDNYFGIYLDHSGTNEISGNTLRSHEDWAIVLLSQSDENEVKNNDLNANINHLGEGASCRNNVYTNNGFDVVIIQNEDISVGNAGGDDEKPYQVPFIVFALIGSIILLSITILVMVRVLKHRIQEHAPIIQNEEEEHEQELLFKELYTGVYECTLNDPVPRWLDEIMKNKRSGTLSRDILPEAIAAWNFSKITYQHEKGKVILKGYE